MPISFCFIAPRSCEWLGKNAKELARQGFQWLEIIAPEEEDRELEKNLIGIRYETGLNFMVHAQVFEANLSTSHPVMRAAAVAVHKADIDFASRIKALGVVVHGGTIGWTDYPPTDHPQYAETQLAIQEFRRGHMISLVKSVRELGKYAQERGVWLGVENLCCPQEMLITPEELLEVLEKVDNPFVGATLDFGHCQVAHQSPLDYVRKLSTRIRHIHIHENDGQYDEHKPIVELKEDWQKSLEIIASGLQEVAVNLEILTQNVGDFTTSLEVVRRGLKR
jgi:sugar phosphate isomerase/epimerase